MKYSNDTMFDIESVEDSLKSLQTKDTPLTNLPTIPEFYAGQEIFITGGTGFIGKVLIEKILRSCPDVKMIYLLLRPKKGRAIDERLKEIFDLPLFDLLRQTNPNFASQVCAIAGDVAELNLALSPESLETMKNVSIIVHSAASVRFDDPLKYAVFVNTRGTREVYKFAETLNNLKLVTHVSTTYSNVFVHTLEEKIYPAAADWRKTIEICEKLETDVLEKFTPHYINFMPNTYVFSKNLAEHVSNYYKDRLPVVLFRPSVVIGAVKEPLQGWVDNFNGPMGILLASVLGISKTMYCDPKNVLDMIPVDICAKSILIATWKGAYKEKQSLPVYNCALGNKTRMTIEQMLDIGAKGVCHEFPMEHQVLVAGGGVTLNQKLNLIRLFFFQIIPAILIDILLKLKGERPRLLHLQRKIHEANKALSYFVTNNWDFKNDNMTSLTSFLRLEDYKDFETRSFVFLDKVFAIRFFTLGFRRYLLKEKDETLDRCKVRYARMKIANQAMKFIFYSFCFYLIFYKFQMIKYLMP